MSGGRPDVVVVGGGPAGLATAIACAARGLSVRVLERRDGVIDKACGEGLMPAAVEALARLGVPARALGGHPVHGITWRDGSRVARARFRGTPALGVRRTRLHAALLERARECKVDVRFGTRVLDLDEVDVEEVRDVNEAGRGGTRYLVGADGLHSRVRRLAGLTARRGRHARFGVRRHFAIAPWTDDVEITWAHGAEAYVTPVGPSEVGVALLVDKESRTGTTRCDTQRARAIPGDARPGHSRAHVAIGDACSVDDVAGEVAPTDEAAMVDGTFDRLLDGRFPGLAARLAGARPTSAARGAGPFRTDVPHVVSGRVLLVGDAAGYVDPITGEGLGIAFRQALALADALAVGAPERYERAARRIAAPHERLTRALLFAQRRPRLRAALVGLFALAPPLFERVLHAQGGTTMAATAAAEPPLAGSGVLRS